MSRGRLDLCRGAGPVRSHSPWGKGLSTFLLTHESWNHPRILERQSDVQAGSVPELTQLAASRTHGRGHSYTQPLYTFHCSDYLQVLGQDNIFPSNIFMPGQVFPLSLSSSSKCL